MMKIKMINLSKDEICVTEDQIEGYSPYRVCVYETNELNALADYIQKAKGELPLFDYSGEYNSEDWYNFYFDTNGKEITSFYFEYGLDGDYGDVIEIDKETKQNAFEVICNYYGGYDEYQKICREYREGGV